MNEIAASTPISRPGAADRMPEPGQWVWVRDTIRYDNEGGLGLKKGETHEWFGCITHIGTNYVAVQAPRRHDGVTSSVRIHFDELDAILRLEPDPDHFIAAQIAIHKAAAQALMDQAAATLANLGFDRSHALAHAAASQDTSKALISLSNAADPKAYGRALTLAKDTTLPELFKRIKAAHGQLAMWMSASLLPLQTTVDGLTSSMAGIEDRLFSTELYAGLTESAAKITEGAPAASHERLRVMQRRLYMDEECLANYDAGGMDFRNIADFDAWLSNPENRDRLLPFPRTFVALRVRRNEKERTADDLRQAFINIQLAELDKYTFFYVRNGDQIFRLQSAFDFPEMIAPSRDFYDPQRPAMFRAFAGRVDEIVPRVEYDEALERYREIERKSDAWKNENPRNEWLRNPFAHKSVRCGSRGHFDPADWHPLNPTSVYYDDACDKLSDAIKTFNRVAIIIQGLFDRSEVLHPHPKVSIWTPDGFERALEIIYDGEHALTSGSPPDFEAYRARLNAQITEDSVLAGQEAYWLRAEAERENERRKNDHRNRWPYSDMCLKTYRPYGNPGPGRLARPARWKPNAKQAVFAWKAERLREAWGKPPHVPKTLTVPATALFNVSAYQPGDYKMFFIDPRTRERYLQWAPFLLLAEDFHAGRARIQTGD